jgi:hypothetical protein
MTPEREQLLRDLWSRGESAGTIASALGVTLATVYNYRFKFKLPIRKITRGRPPTSKKPLKQTFEHKIERVAFETSRLMEFCTQPELVNQTGHEEDDWPRVIIKELVDNALDACEEDGIAPVIGVTVVTAEDPAQVVFTIEDNGPGIPPATVAGILDYTKRVSSREAYVSPTRGAQGNALKTVLPMGYVLKGDNDNIEDGVTVIEARGVAHTIRFSVDRIRLEPMIEHTKAPSSVRQGTKITIAWPGCWLDVDARETIVELVSAFSWVNPHLAIRLTWNSDILVSAEPTNTAWSKLSPSSPTCPHWYDYQRFERYMAAHVARGQKRGRAKYTVREFVGDFRGLRSTIKQKAILEELNAAHLTLEDFIGTAQKINSDRVAQLLAVMKRHTKPIKPELIGVIGQAHFLARFEAAGGNPKTFEYRRKCKLIDGVPRVIEFAFGITSKGLEGNSDEQLRLVNAVDWSAAIGNPFRSLGRMGEGAEALLRKLRVDWDDPVIAALHYACPRVAYLDRGKSSIGLG